MLRPLDPYERCDVARKEELFRENSLDYSVLALYWSVYTLIQNHMLIHKYISLHHQELCSTVLGSKENDSSVSAGQYDPQKEPEISIG